MKSEKPEIQSAVVLLSGGVDSTTLLMYVVKRLKVSNVHAVSFFYGQKHARELEMARWQARAAGVVHRELDIGCFGELARGSALTDAATKVPDLTEIGPESRSQPSTYVPNRNMIFLSIAAAYAEANHIENVFYGAQAQDEYGYWDCTVDFVARMNHILALNRLRPVRIYAPFVEKPKKEVVEIGRDLGVDYDHTWTCYRGEDVPCGTCPSCVERARAFGVRSEEG